MYLNILLKRKKEPTHHFSFNGSTNVETDKEHIHRGFKEHNGLSYNFNGSTKYSTDSKLLYKVFTKNYESSHFNHSTDNKEYLKQFHLNPQTKPIELYTAYKNKYPKMSDNEYSIENWQTEAGNSNELNRFLRQDDLGKSIEDIAEEDKIYKNGLLELQNKINRKTENIKKKFDSEIINANEMDQKLKKLENYKIKTNQYSKRYNPVNIRPAIYEPIQKKINIEMDLLEEFKKNR